MSSRSVRRSRLTGLSTAGVTGLVAITALAACGSSGTSSSAQPSSSSSADSRTVNIEITDSGCPAPKSEYTAGPLNFSIKNKNATGVTEFELLSGERIVGEKENLAPGFSGTFSLSLVAG